MQICHSSGKKKKKAVKQFKIFLPEWEKCLRISEPLIISLCALHLNRLFAVTSLNFVESSLFTAKEFKGREIGQQIQGPAHILV